MKRLSPIGSVTLVLLMLCSLLLTALPVCAEKETNSCGALCSVNVKEGYTVIGETAVTVLDTECIGVSCTDAMHTFGGVKPARETKKEEISVPPDTGVKSKSWLWIVLVVAAAVCAVTLLLTKKKD